MNCPKCCQPIRFGGNPPCGCGSFSTEPIGRMIDAVVVCTLCGAGMGQCDCWVTLKCTNCAAQTAVQREPEFFDFDEVDTLCPKCRGATDVD